MKSQRYMPVILVGTFPPPVHGMATMNQAIFERLVREGWVVEKINTSPQDVDKIIFSIILRLKIFFSIWIGLLFDKDFSKKLVYIALSGGLGQIYDIITALLCRLMGAKLVLHHHSVSYLDKKRLITSFLFQIAGRSTIHIVLCESMKINLQKKYEELQVLVLSNIALLHPVDIYKDRDKVQIIGYLSNITREKGGWDIIRLAEAVQSKGLPIKFRIAGTCQDDTLRKALQKASKQGSLEWIGPVYDEQKSRYLNSIDLFLFPTHYKNEAEPLVVWESLMFGVPVIAYDRGCISAQVDQAGEIIPQDVDFVEKTMKVLIFWINNPSVYCAYVKEATERFEIARKKAEGQWERLGNILKN
jgi:glycosyltransferase involved in cell wall biosynthesis